MIIIKNIFKKYGDNVIFSDFNLTVNKGDMISISGKSGSGKSTILNIIGLLDYFDSGEVSIDGNINVDINSKEAMLLRRDKIGYLFQSYALIEDESIYKNLELSLRYEKISKSEKIKKMSKVLHDVRLEKDLSEKIKKLSGGEKQRVAIARLMLKDYEILLADEPTGSLDEANRDIILSLLKREHEKGKTIIIVSHDNYVKNFCDRSVLI